MIPTQFALVSAIVLGAALRGLVAALAVWIGLRLLRVSNVVALKAAWSLVLIAALAMPLVPEHGLLPDWAAVRLPASTVWMSDKAAAPDTAAVPATAAREQIQPDAQQFSAIDWTAEASPVSRARPTSKSSAPIEPASTPAVSAAPLASRPAPAPRLNRTGLWLAWGAAAVYLAVFAGLLLRLLVGVGTAMLLWRKAEPVTATTTAAGPLRASPQVSSPVNIGSGILLPAGYSAWDENKLRVVVAHESSHIRQGDFYLQLLAGVYAALFWFSPLGWWLKRKLYELGEAISDRAGLVEAGSRSHYAQLLLEFAALPRPTLTGVAMARTSHLAQRIERLLNETRFRQSFAAGGRRALAAVLLVPVALIAAATLVRVEAATPAAQDQAAQAATTGQSTPEPVTDQAPPPPAQPQDAAPSADVPPPTPGPGPAPEAQPGPRPFGAGPDAQPRPPMPPNPDKGMGPMAGGPPMPPEPRDDHGRHFGPGFGFGPMGQPYAIVDADGKIILPNGMIRMDAEGPHMDGLDKARKAAHGPFLWFEHDDKSYIVQDQAIVNQVEAMNKSMENLHEQMSVLGKQMHAVGDQQREMSRKMRDATVQTPDLTKEIADLNATAAALKAKQGSTISQKDLSDLQRQVGRIQVELMSLQVKVGMQADQMSALGNFGGQMGELGGQMGKLGALMGKVAREDHDKMQGIIEDSLANGKAKPVE